MSTSRPPSGPPVASPGYDPLLDPIPQPSVKERDTDTGWAEFDSLMSEIPAEDEPPPDFAETLPAPVDFAETEPFDRNAHS